MLNQAVLESALPVGRFGVPLHLYQSIGSTNDRAAALARDGAPEGALVLAMEQTAGRGRRNRSWDTPAGAGLALSCVLRPPDDRILALGLIGGLAVVAALEGRQLPATIKWPNDVLLDGKKVAGVLAESSWSGPELEHVVLGIGINLRSAQEFERSDYDYPSSAIEQYAGEALEANRLVLKVLQGLELWYGRYLTGSAHPRWEQQLAFVGEHVRVLEDGPSRAAASVEGKVLGLTKAGGLRLAAPDGSEIELEGSQVRLRPGKSGLA